MIEVYRRPMQGTQPEYRFPPYGSTAKRAPTKPLVMLPHTLSETTGPVFGHDSVKAGEFDLTVGHAGEPAVGLGDSPGQPGLRPGDSSGQPIGKKIVVSGRVLDDGGKPVRHTLVEIWQANSAGRYRHPNDGPHSPLDPNFTGCGRAMTDAEGRYRFVTIEPGAYPWRNHYNAWRPKHIHFSLWGAAFTQRLVTQMYFPGDPLLPFDPIFNCVTDAKARGRLVSALDWETTIPESAIGYRFDIVLRGRHATPVDR